MITQQSFDLAHAIHTSRLQEAESYRLLRQYEASQPDKPVAITRLLRYLLTLLAPIWPISYQIH